MSKDTAAVERYSNWLETDSEVASMWATSCRLPGHLACGLTRRADDGRTIITIYGKSPRCTVYVGLAKARPNYLSVSCREHHVVDFLFCNFLSFGAFFLQMYMSCYVSAASKQKRTLFMHVVLNWCVYCAAAVDMPGFTSSGLYRSCCM